jgi:hypothetical protein
MQASGNITVAQLLGREQNHFGTPDLLLRTFLAAFDLGEHSSLTFSQHNRFRTAFRHISSSSRDGLREDDIIGSEEACSVSIYSPR